MNHNNQNLNRNFYSNINNRNQNLGNVGMGAGAGAGVGGAGAGAGAGAGSSGGAGLSLHPTQLQGADLGLGAGSGSINPFTSCERQTYNNYIPQFNIRSTPKNLIPRSSNWEGNGFGEKGRENMADIISSNNDRTKMMLEMNKEKKFY